MRLLDLIEISYRNLRARSVRTLLGLLGIMLGCEIFLLTLSGTRGAADSLIALVSESDKAKQIVLPSYRQSVMPPEEIVQIVGEMDEARRSALSQRLQEEWMSQYGHQTRVSLADLQSISEMEHVVEVMPRVSLPMELEYQGQIWQTFAGAISQLDPSLEKRLLAGSLPLKSDELMLTEFAAYHLGCPTAEQAANLVGQSIKVRMARQTSESLSFSSLLYQGESTEPVTMLEAAEWSEAIAQILREGDLSILSDSQRQLLEQALAKPSSSNDEPTTYVEREFRVVGVLKLEGADQGTPDLLNFMSNQVPDIGIDHQVLYALADEVSDEPTFYDSIVRIDSTQHLKPLTDSLKSKGFESYSGAWLLDDISYQIGQAKWVVFGVAGLVLLVTAIGISNTLVISVLERIPEFGIMKSLGASHRHIVGMMLFEGGFLGFAGGVLAILISVPTSWIIEGWVKQYVSFRIGRPFAGEIFQPEMWDGLIVLLIAILIGMLASLLPAVRAARLNPIEAFRRGT